MNPALVVIVGPTAVGKTKTSIEVAKAFDGEVMNSDSMQVYKGLDIGTAKIKEDEKEGIPHHLFDIKSPNEDYSVASFQEDATNKIKEIHNRDHLPIMVGGTGLYVRSVTHGYTFTDATADPAYRDELENYVEQYGVEALHNRLRSVDPKRAAEVHPNNVRRVIRSLEIYHTKGHLDQQSNATRENTSPYHLVTIGLKMKREQLYDRINRRVDIMMQEGLLEEVQALHRDGIRNTQAVQAIGYKELYEYFDGECTLDEAILKLKRNSRRYAKRQMTWFRHQMDVEWFDVTNESIEEKIPSILRYVAGKLHLESN
ncbi:tRNA (adenosine(37)-N6)-dimethylallyltransferase MiaA [Pseudalkalibacillus berkeleyi]|uniref:tRNA dimethylallyltransferase n=1 Tax=Pseudalkalibacillus berkeleyi TaxID=1069813 RepID=A0ABS9GWN8_9BACL|nr:tRNA (adenosine(37)-N6)-dimethylallyltransferase MiaA [Pseudalkalibacillus berkeleyi]MCF6137194.1 tRNA (adenosine(37)-N6)-dimethylallyltransferase MiaA [Pseudalkalibacillus berkeleyi]